MTERCIGCGSDKRLVHSEPFAVWWECDVCGLSKEEFVGSEPPC